MIVQRIQNNTTFGAKLNITGKYFVSDEYKSLIEKADKIGFENDIVELNYTNYRDGSIEFLNTKPLHYLKKISTMFKARYIPNGEGEGTEWHKEYVSGDNYKEFWKREYKVASGYLDRLAEKYPNERLGVSIIEN